MGQTGPQWSLYPLLAIIALCEFSCGVVHLLFCLPLYFLCLPLINGVLGLLASFHAIFLRYPNRCSFYMQFTCTFTSFWFFFSSLLETYCVGDFQNTNHEEEVNEGVCYGLKYRTIGMGESCVDFLGPLQMSFLTKIGWEAKDRDSIRFFITASLSILSGIHLCCTTALTFYSATEIKIRLYSYHYQLAIGILVAFTGIFHFRFCCTFFFLGLPFAVGVYSMIQGVVSWRTKCHGSVSRAMNVAGAALALLMLAAAVFGIFCWFNRNNTPHSITRHCHWLPKTEDYCLRVIYFSHPYIDWSPIETEREIAVIQVRSLRIPDVTVTCILQIIIYIFLFAFSFLQFAFSMKSAFTTKLIQLYY
ncbi:unnamed protein product [Haemonchus placei]|uniref:AcidPPc domain-containing protein n=1 Tax=Haemonchus placei TaxID=6290 RepID=A0A158QPV2_HAEPC|nr:unnamed protein product [Haemonchus placei]